MQLGSHIKIPDTTVFYSVCMCVYVCVMGGAYSLWEISITQFSCVSECFSILFQITSFHPQCWCTCDLGKRDPSDHLSCSHNHNTEVQFPKALLFN